MLGSLPGDSHWESELSSATGPHAAAAPAARASSLHSRAAEVVAGSAPASLFAMPSEAQLRAQAMLDAAAADAAPAKRASGHRREQATATLARACGLRCVITGLSCHY